MALDYLRKEFLNEARVIDAAKGYISVPSFNLRMKPAVLKTAAKVIAAHFKKDKVEVVHGIPGKRVLKEGDVVGIDAGVIYQGFQADAAVTIGLGNISSEAEHLIATTQKAIMAGIAAARGGARLSDISYAVQQTAESAGFSVVREYVGHGIGRAMHEEPQVPNFGPPGRGVLLRPGMALAIEPMVNVGDWRTNVGPDNWTVYTSDGSLSAHFEHSIAITDGEAEILTRL